MFACRNFGERDVFGSNCGSLAYEDFEKELLVTKRYGEQYMKVTVESLRRGALELSEAATGNKGQRLSVLLVLAPFCAVRYINDPRFLPGDEESREHKRMSTRGGNVAFKCVAPRSR